MYFCIVNVNSRVMICTFISIAPVGSRLQGFKPCVRRFELHDLERLIYILKWARQYNNYLLLLIIKFGRSRAEMRELDSAGSGVEVRGSRRFRPTEVSSLHGRSVFVVGFFSTLLSQWEFFPCEIRVAVPEESQTATESRKPTLMNY